MKEVFQTPKNAWAYRGRRWSRWAKKIIIHTLHHKILPFDLQILHQRLKYLGQESTKNIHEQEWPNERDSSANIQIRPSSKI